MTSLTLKNLGKLFLTVYLLRKPKKLAKKEAGHPRNKDAKNVTNQKVKAVKTTKEIQTPVKTLPKHYRYDL